MKVITGTLRQKADKLGINGDIAYQRVKRGWSEEEALYTPIGDRRPDRVRTTTPIMAQTGTMMAAAELWRVKGDKKRTGVIDKLISGDK